MKEPKKPLDPMEVEELERNSMLAFNYPSIGTGKKIEVSAAILYRLCKEWLEARKKQ